MVDQAGGNAIVLPMQDRARLGHGYAGWLAAKYGFDMLHIKGAAADVRLGREGRGGSDTDVLVRPSQTESVLAVLRSHGWKLATSFEAGSVFEHAANLFHEQWGTLDLHVYFPGIRLSREDAFDLMWADREEISLGGHVCAVPSLGCQRLILLIHAARSGQAEADPDVKNNWWDLNPSERAALQHLARQFGAEVALAAATGRLHQYRGDPEYQLWDVFAHGGTLLEGWSARLRGADGIRGKVRVLRHIVMPNREQLSLRYGHAPTTANVIEYYGGRIARVGRQSYEAIAARWTRTIRQRHGRGDTQG